MATEIAGRQGPKNGPVAVPRPSDEELTSFSTGLRSLTSFLVERSAWARKVGLDTFLGKRNVSEALGYLDLITPIEYRVRYERGGLAGRIVDVYPTATWRGGIDIYEDEDPDNDTKFELDVKELMERLKLWSKFKRADRQCGLGQYSVILLGAAGSWETELPKSTKGSKGLLYVTPFSQEDATIDTYDENPQSERFGQPLGYKLNRKRVKGPTDRPVHWSRCIHLVEDPLDDELCGQPRLQRPWNRLDDLEKVIGGGSEAFWIRATQGLHIDIDKDMKFDPKSEEAKSFAKMIEEYAHKLTRIIRTRGAKVTSLGSDVADFSAQADAIVTQIAGMIAVPKRILTGSEMGQLASGQDRDNWDTQVADRRTSHAEPVVVRPFFDRLIDYGYVAKPVEYYVGWPETANMTETERAEGAKAWAATNQTNIEPVFTSDEIRDHWYDMEPLNPDDLLDPTLLQDPALMTPDPNAVVDPNADPNAQQPPLQRAATLNSLQRAIDRHTTALRKDISRAGRMARESVQLSEIEAGIRAHDLARVNIAVFPALTVYEQQLAGLQGRLRSALADAGNIALRHLPRRNVTTAAAGPKPIETLSFEVTNADAVGWARQEAARLITSISSDARDAISGVIEKAINEGIPPRQAATLIRSSVGLTSQQSEAVANLYGRIVVSKGKTILAGKTRIHVPSNGASPELLDRATSAYANRLLRQRTETIAQHEILEAANQGQRQAWRQAEQKGLIGKDQLKTLIQVDPCVKCASMSGEVVGINEDFSDGLPPFHVRCQCLEGLI